MPRLCKEVMSILKLHEILLRKSHEVVQEIQKQAPAAKMVGRFTVKFAVTELSKVAARLSNKTDDQHSGEPPKDQSS
jgi:hypothetical protein